jgi:hypothetical protein
MVQYIFHSVSYLPTPGIPLLVKLDDGSIVDAIRPSYITDRRQSDLGYRTPNGDVLSNVVEWAIK